MFMSDASTTRTLVPSVKPIVIISDSLALPRLHPDKVEVQDTYPALLHARFGSVLNVGYGFATSNEILWQAGYFSNVANQGFTILNFGIVDCTPRALSNKEAWILRKLGVRLPSFFTYWLRQRRTIRFVQPNKFRQNCEALKQLSLGHLLVLAIAPASDAFERDAPGIKDSIEIYNEILESIFEKSFLRVPLDIDHDIMSDHHHLTTNGHHRIYKSIAKHIDGLIQKNTAQKYSIEHPIS